MFCNEKQRYCMTQWGKKFYEKKPISTAWNSATTPKGWIIPTIVAKSRNPVILEPLSKHPTIQQINGCTIKDLFVCKLEEIKTIFRVSEPAQSVIKWARLTKRYGTLSQTGICQAKVYHRGLTIDPYANQFHNASGRTRRGIRWFNSATGGRFTYCTGSLRLRRSVNQSGSHRRTVRDAWRGQNHKPHKKNGRFIAYHENMDRLKGWQLT